MSDTAKQDTPQKHHELLVSTSPHVRSGESVERIMWSVNIALLPALAGGVYFFGIRALWVVGLAIAAAMLSEWIVNRMTCTPNTLKDGSAFLTGLLLGLNLPPSSPAYVPIIGSLVAVAICKQLFGGLGYNIFNPALVGRAFVLITWPRAMTTWSAPTTGGQGIMSMDATTTATPLGLMKEEGLHAIIEKFGDMGTLYKGLFFGNVGGSIGETSALLILIGVAFLFIKRYITWHIPVSFIATVAIVAWIFGKDPETGKLALFAGDPLFHVLSGGMMLGAFFMATDYVTAPSVRSGQILFGVGCGLITMLIRLKGGFPEGVMFGILLMNCFTPVIDRNMGMKTFGQRGPAPKPPPKAGH
jgi:electron transport complex protein RnfD